MEGPVVTRHGPRPTPRSDSALAAARGRAEGHLGDAGTSTVVRLGAALRGTAESRPSKPCADFTHGSLNLAAGPPADGQFVESRRYLRGRSAPRSGPRLPLGSSPSPPRTPSPCPATRAPGGSPRTILCSSITDGSGIDSPLLP